MSGTGGVMRSQIDHEMDRRRRGPAGASLIIAATMATVLAGLPVPASAEEPSRLQGAWECVTDGTRSVLEFQSSTELSYDGVTMTYELVDDAIFVGDEYGAVPYYYYYYYYGFEGDSLVILSPDGSIMWCDESAQPVPSPTAPGPGSGTATVGPGILMPGPDWPAYEPPPEPVSEDAPSPQALLYKFAGRWDNVTTNTSTSLYLYPDGAYERSYEASYSGDFEEGGSQSGSWGATGAEQDRGHWMIEGSLAEGTLPLIDPNGDRSAFRYQVHVEDGECYWGEYLFDGELYQVTYVYR
jgi:hypothetical protein